MLNETNYRNFLPEELYRQIETLCGDVRSIRDEAASLMHVSKVPDAKAQLNDVLQSTEDATNTIIDCVSAMQSVVDESGASDETRQKIAEQVGKVYEACNFQDLTGQRIKKVLSGFGALEDRLNRLSDTAHKYADPNAKPPAPPAPSADDILLEGPQLSANAPTQAEIDALMNSFVKTNSGIDLGTERGGSRSGSHNPLSDSSDGDASDGDASGDDGGNGDAGAPDGHAY